MENELALYVIVVIGLLLFAGLLFVSFNSNRTNYTGPGGNTPLVTNTISISATGTAYNTSSQSQLYVTVNATGITANATVQNLTKTLNSFNSTILPYVNHNLSDITTQYFNVYKLYNQTGYEATESLTVTIPNISNTSAALGALSALNGVYVSEASPQLSTYQISELRTKALSLALVNATSQAYALIGNSSTIYATNISVNTYRVFPFPVVAEGGAAGGASAPALQNNTFSPQFYGGRSSVTESITVVFTYKRNN